MSIDTQDFARVTTTAQAGNQHPSFWPIVIQTKTLSLLQELEVSINPCDAIWMPTLYDISLGPNPGQPYAKPGVEQPAGFSYFFPNPSQIGINPPFVTAAIVGTNVCDVYENGYLVQMAPLFSIRINSPNNPWLLFGLSTQLATPFKGQLQQYWPAGQGGCMRSITGPISRLWVKFYQFASWQRLPTVPGQDQMSGPVGDPPGYSTVVLMSSLGYMQQTIERVQTRDDQGPTPLVAAWQQTIVSGGYQTPQMNTADRRSLERL